MKGGRPLLLCGGRGEGLSGRPLLFWLAVGGRYSRSVQERVKKVCSDRRHIEGPQRKSGRGKNLSKKSGVSADVSWSGKMKAPPPPWHGDLNICGVYGDSFLRIKANLLPHNSSKKIVYV